MEYYTAVNCMDGRVQLPVIEYLQKKYGIQFVDMITEAGPNRILAEQTDPVLVESILSRIIISFKKNASEHIVVVGHYGCLGNPADEEEQREHTLKAVQGIKEKFKNAEVVGLWVDERSDVMEVK